MISTEAFIERVQGLRRARGWSLQRLSEESGVPAITLRRMSSGAKSRVTLDEATRMCAALGVDLRDAISDEPMRLEV